MSNMTFSESICLSSEDIDTDRPADKTTNSRFVQQGRLFRYEAHFSIFNEHFIEVRTNGVFRHPRSYELDCTFLDPHARRVLRIDWWSAGVFLLLLSCALALPWLAASSAISTLALAGSVVLMFGAAAAALLVCLHRSSDSVVFYTRHGRAPLLRFLNRNPTAAELECFVSDISERIQRASAQWDNKQQFLSAELKEHRRLKDQGILTPESYEAVKRRILGKHG
jgi:hypothetical protein